MSGPNRYQLERGFCEERIRGPAFYVLIALFVGVVYLIVWAIAPKIGLGAESDGNGSVSYEYVTSLAERGLIDPIDDLLIPAGNGGLVFHSDGRIELTGNATPDEAAQQFIEALRPYFAAMCRQQKKGPQP